MANLGNIIKEKTEKDSEWKEQRQMEKENAVTMREAGVTEITSTPESYVKYLEMQGSNPTYSAGNVILAMLQLPEATVIGTRDRWKSLGRTLVAGEEDNGAKIFARATYPAKGYILADAYDVSQTQGRALKSPHLHDDSKEMEQALITLLNYSPVPVVPDNELDCGAIYDAERMELHINPACTDSEAFAAISTGIAHARFHNKGYNRYYDYAESRLDAESVSFILCRRFGVERELPDASNVAMLYKDWTPEERISQLDKVQGMAKQIGGGIDNALSHQQQKGRLPARNQTR